MKKLSENIIQFFDKQSFVIVSSIDENGRAHNSCKGIVKIEERGLIYLLDVYRGRTYENLNRNSNISIASVDEHKFTGYCLKGRALKIEEEKIDEAFLEAWEQRINSRITQRLIKNIQVEKSQKNHPESILPKPEYLILMEVDEVVDLTPAHMNIR